MKNALKFLSLLLGILFISQLSLAQEVLSYNLYAVNPFLLNPAATGNEGVLTGFVNYHNQMTNFGTSPAVMTFGVHSPVGNNFSVGTDVIKDSRTALTHTYGNLFLAYQMRLSKHQRLVLGVSGGLIDNNFDQSKVISADAGDLLDQASYYKHTSFTGGAGLMYSLYSFQFHAAIPQLLDRNNKFVNQMNIGAFYDHQINPTWAIKPSVMYRKIDTNTPQLDFNLMGIWNKTLWAQAGVRTDQSYILSVGVNYKAFVLAYAYQMNTGKVNSVVNGAHEFQLSLKLGRAKKKQDPIANETPRIDTVKVVVNQVKHDTVTLVKVDTVYKTKENLNAIQPEYLTPEEISQLTPEQLLSLKIVKQYYPATDLKTMLQNYQSVIGLKIKLPRITFITDKSELTQESKLIVDSVVRLMEEYPRIRIQISGHTDGQGNDEYNLKLSKDRAKSVYTYIKNRGIAANRLEYEGYGKRRPIASNDTPEGRLENRRVDFMFIK